MNKFQPVKFHSVEEFLDFLPPHELDIVLILRQLILEGIPLVQERLAYNVPFYYRFSRICFIWPSAVPWGKVPATGVQLGFTKGYLLRDELGYLEKGDRKHVYIKTFYSAREIETDMVKAYIHEAVKVDETSRRG